MKKIEKLIIIGSGPAGLTAAIYAARGGLDPLIIIGDTLGGQPTIATEIEDYPGFPEGIKGPELVEFFKKQAERFKARFLEGKVVEVNFSQSPFEIKLEDQTLFARAVILAVGSTPLWLNLPSEQKLIGKGVAICATCDGPLFKGKEVAVIGGGDSAMKEAYYLSKLAKNVTLINNQNTLQAQKALQKQVKKRPNVKFLLNSLVEKVLGEDKVTGLKIKNTQNGQVSQIEVDGVFMAIGRQPATDFLKKQVELNDQNYIKVKEGTKTSVPGVFAAGDAADPIYRQIITAAASGCKAALDARKYLEGV